MIAQDLVLVQPMSSITGVVTYIKYEYGTTKGATTAGTVVNTPFALGNVDSTYTSSRVVESFTGDNSTVAFALAWDAALLDNGKLKGGKITVDGSEVTAYTAATASGVTTVTFTTAPATGKAIRIAYVYDNEVVPQNEIPTLKAELASIPVFAKARRIGIYYSQIAQFQAKTDYGFDLADQLAEKAVGQLQYEIDTEVVEFLDEMAGNENADLTWSKNPLVGVSKQEHYAAFAEILEIGKQKIYDLTQRFAPNWMICASNVIPVLAFMPNFKQATTGAINGPYFAGTVGSLKVYVSPKIAPGRFVLGCLGSDMQSAPAAYCPYMPIVPTALLEFADGLNTQGFSTMYDLVKLNENLVIAGKITA